MLKQEENAAYCLNIVRSDDPDRYLLSLFAPNKAQRALWALYAFNQEIAKIRETVSEPMLGEIRIQWWQDVLTEISEGQVREQPVIAEMALILEQIPVSSLLLEMLEARKSDLLGEGTASFDALISYADKVGGALYEAASQIVTGELSRAAQTASRKLGSAWAMLGLVRALPYSWQANAPALTEEMKPGMQSTDAADANALLQPIIGKMLEFVADQMSIASSLQTEMNKREQPLLLLATQIKLYLEALKLANNNPFDLPQHEPTQFKKLRTLLWAKITGRY